MEQKTIKRITNLNQPLLKAVDRMVRNVRVKITPKFRKYWGAECLGQWFYIQKINDDNTVQLCGQYHDIFTNVPLEEIIF